jgi:hypothetical protein
LFGCSVLLRFFFFFFFCELTHIGPPVSQFYSARLRYVYRFVICYVPLKGQLIKFICCSRYLIYLCVVLFQ